jgi:hypothetical protein
MKKGTLWGTGGLVYYGTPSSPDTYIPSETYRKSRLKRDAVPIMRLQNEGIVQPIDTTSQTPLDLAGHLSQLTIFDSLPHGSPEPQEGMAGGRVCRGITRSSDTRIQSKRFHMSESSSNPISNMKLVTANDVTSLVFCIIH